MPPIHCQLLSNMLKETCNFGISVNTLIQHQYYYIQHFHYKAAAVPLPCTESHVIPSSDTHIHTMTLCSSIWKRHTHNHRNEITHCCQSTPWYKYCQLAVHITVHINTPNNRLLYCSHPGGLFKTTQWT